MTDPDEDGPPGRARPSLRARPLPSPRALCARLPADAGIRAQVDRTRRAVRDLLHGRDRRLLVVVGPCSIHHPGAALTYAERLARVAERVSGELLLVMRTYLEKPRTTVGWKGLLNDPALDGGCDVPRGLARARELLLGVNALGVPCASELLDPLVPRYLADLLAWAAIGARTAESQTHRELASAVALPVGFKNGTDGDVATACNAVLAARHPHHFLGIDDRGRPAAIASPGNPDGHLVLRGARDRPNYTAADVAAAAARFPVGGPTRPVLVDCSHANSARDPRRQAAVCGAVLAQVRSGSPSLLGVMLESQLEEGQQRVERGRRPAPGLSITDGCIGWPETEKLLYACAESAAAAPSPVAAASSSTAVAPSSGRC